MNVTVEMIGNIPAGRELDALIAEYVIGLPRNVIVLGPNSEEREFGSLGMVLTTPIEEYSACMGSAWTVVERMQELEAEGATNAIWWNFWQSGRLHIWELEAEEAAAQICKAALAAVVIPMPSYREFFDRFGELAE